MEETSLEQNTSQETRPPVVGIFGHIDHGKSTLIDYIRKTNITEKEAGGITQHVSAYEVSRQNTSGAWQKITFIDTPGHEAFQSARSKGASACDIAILIVSAEDGVKPQTLEVLKRIQEAKLPFIVAITKIDKASADITKAKTSLAENGVYVEGFGGNTPVVALSAVTGEGVDELLEMIALVSELENFAGQKEVLASGVIIEGKLDPKRGITGVGIIKNGTMRRGLFVASKGAMAPLRLLIDAEGQTAEELSFSSPVQIVGWDAMPKVGEEFRTFLKKEEALEYKNSISEPVSRAGAVEEDMAYLPLVVKADTVGSLEAIFGELGKLGSERIKARVIASGVGSVNENDVKTALTSKSSLILAFNTKTDNQAKALAERNNLSIINKNIIYELLDEVKQILIEREPRVEVEETFGSAKVLKIFSTNKGKQVLGARMLSGEFVEGALFRILRRESEVGRGRVKELQSAKVRTKSVAEGAEFGAMVESKLEVAPGDILEALRTVTK